VLSIPTYKIQLSVAGILGCFSFIFVFMLSSFLACLRFLEIVMFHVLFASKAL
jgi:hypothetical protein